MGFDEIHNRSDICTQLLEICTMTSIDHLGMVLKLTACLIVVTYPLKFCVANAVCRLVLRFIITTMMLALKSAPT